MEDSQLRQLKYIVESNVPWKPGKCVVPPWEKGLIPKHTVDYIVEITTIALEDE